MPVCQSVFTPEDSNLTQKIVIVKSRGSDHSAKKVETFLVFLKHSSVQRSLETRSDSRQLVAGKCKAGAGKKG